MKVAFLVKRAAAILLVWFWGTSSTLHGAAANPELLKAKREAEAKGYIFLTSHNEIIAEAKKEGKLRVLSGLDSMKSMREAFVKRYPFIDVYVEEITGTDAGQRFVMEVKTNAVRDWDVIHVTSDFYNEFPPYLRKFDLLGMAQQGILNIPVGMVDPRNRTVVALTSSVTVVAYNRILISSEKVPGQWEDFLKPEFKGKKFVADVRPLGLRGLMPLMGSDWVLNFCRKLAAQEPVWVSGQTRGLASMAAGEYPLFAGVNYHSTMRAMKKNPMGNLQMKLVEPVPVRVSATEGIINNARNPYTALLWLEFEGSPEGQEVIDKHEPLKSSLYSRGSSVENLISGKKLSVLDWDHFANSPEWMGKIVEAFGFPKAEDARPNR